jgi:hypothetical protein
VVNEFLPDGIRIMARLPQLMALDSISQADNAEDVSITENVPLLSNNESIQKPDVSFDGQPGDFQGQLLK